MILYKKLNCPSSQLSRHLKWLCPVTAPASVSGLCNPIQAAQTLLGPVILPVPSHIQQVSTASVALSEKLV